ncbi:MAG TPA: YbaB/EbfC family nucleoid-associated protein [Mycobacteriales bacterium]|nr:YbaB/EbfC family nucleoid-associated protein [Mycobacteriales bacterium]
MANLDMARVERLRTAVERAAVTVTSPDHAVRVTVGPGGAISELDLTTLATRRGGPALAGLITDTIGRATAELEASLAAELRDLTGGRADPAGLLAGSLPPPAEPPAPAHPRPDGAARTGGDLPGGDLPGGDLPGGELVERLRAESARTLDGYAQLREESAGMTTAASSPDGAITVTVRPDGAIADLRIDDAATRHGPGNLGRLVLATIQRARATSALRAGKRAQELAGPTLSIQDMVASVIPPELRPDDDTGQDRPGGGRR